MVWDWIGLERREGLGPGIGDCGLTMIWNLCWLRDGDLEL
jgi:hypothetical protein